MKKYLLSIAIFLVLLVASTIFLPYLFKDRIVEFVKQEGNKQLTAQLDFDPAVSVNIFRSFPDLSIGFTNFLISDSTKSFENDTFMYARKSNITIDLFEWYRNDLYEVKEIELKSPFVNAEIDTDENENWDIFKDPDSDNLLELKLRSVSVTNGRFQYADGPSEIKAIAHAISHSSTGSLEENILSLVSTTKAQDFEVYYKGISYVDQWDISQDGSFTYDYNKSQFEFPENQLLLNGLPIEMSGSIQSLNDALEFDLEAHATSSNVAHYLTLIPAIYASDFQSIQTKGSGNFAAKFKGQYGEKSFPSYNLVLDMHEGYFKYPNQKFAAKDLNLDLIINNPTGNDGDLVINIPDIHLKVNNNPFDGSLLVNNVFGDPDINAKAVGIINLEDFKSLLPLEHISKARGTVYTNIEMQGPLSGIKAADASSFLASGKVETEQLLIQTTGMNEVFIIDEAQFILKDQELIVPILSAKQGGNDAEFSGILKNWLGYYFSDEKLEVDGKLYANNLDLNDYMEMDSTSNQALLVIPGNVQANLDAQINEVAFDNLILRNVKGNANILERKLSVNELTTNALGGNVLLNGSYQYNSEKPHSTFTISYSNINLASLFGNFTFLKTIVPIADQVNALTSATLSFDSDLNLDMTPILSNINFGGGINLQNVKMEGIKALQQIDKVLGTSHFDIKEMNDLNVNFNIKEGRIFVEPFELFIDSAHLLLTGESKIDGSIDYSGLLGIPSSYVKDSLHYAELLKNTFLANYKLKSDEFIDLNVKLKGTFQNPELSLGVQKIRENINQTVKRVVKQEVENKRKEVENTAKKEAEKIRKETEKKAREEQDKIKAELDRKKKEAEERLRREAEAKKEALKKEAGKRLRDIINRTTGG